MLKKSKNLTKIVNIEEENFQIFRKTSGISMKFSEKVRVMIILKYTKNQGFTFSRKSAFFGKSTGG